MIDKCKWEPVTKFKYHENYFGTKNYHKTECNNKGNLLLNMTKCHYCGKLIEEVKDERE